MVNQADRPLKKVTLNLFQDDVEFFKEHYPSNYSEEIRKAVNKFVLNYLHPEDDHNE